MVTFGAAVRASRLAHKLTQAELAELMGIQQPHISRIEADTSEVKEETMHSAAAALGEPVSVMLGRVGL